MWDRDDSFCETDGVEPVTNVFDLSGGEEETSFAVLECTFQEHHINSCTSRDRSVG